MRIGPARLAALEVLRAVRGGSFIDRALEEAASGLEPGDRRLAQELSYGVVRLRGRLDRVLGVLVRGGLASLEPDVLDVLRLGAYQLMQLDRVPAYAAISDSVEAARRASGEGAASLTNAVLRRLDREGVPAGAFPELDTDPLDHLASWGSHPRWLLERWLARWPPGEVARLTEYNNRRSAVYLSVTGGCEEALARLGAEGVDAERVESAPMSVRVDPSELEAALGAVRAVVQDPAATAVVIYADLERDEEVADLCAAPGGKAALLALRGQQVYAFDISRRRLSSLLENRRRLGLRDLRVARADARHPPVREGRLGALLLDVPCTGTGTLGRHPDARWRIGPDDLRNLVTLQRELLEASAPLVGPNGILVYATCSLEPEENEEQVGAFLARHDGEFVIERPAEGSVPGDLLTTAGELSILPQRHGMDGVYAARLRRIG